jgi:aminoglycoside phosphotransferase (APT) family kinase protein
MGTVKTREIALIAKMRDALGLMQPPPTKATIAHCDYRLSNCMIKPEGPVAGVLD